MNVTFASGMTVSSVNIQLIADSLIERDEQFNVALSIPSSAGRGITAGNRDSAVVLIMDDVSYSKWMNAQYNTML